MNELRSHRGLLGISQTKLARLAGVSRFKICLFELGDGQLTADELDRIRAALKAQADHLRSLPVDLDLDASIGALDEAYPARGGQAS